MLCRKMLKRILDFKNRIFRVQDCSRSFTTIQDHSTIQIPEFLIVTLNRFKPEVRWRHTVLRISVPNLDIFGQKRRRQKSAKFHKLIIFRYFRSKNAFNNFESFWVNFENFSKIIIFYDSFRSKTTIKSFRVVLIRFFSKITMFCHLGKYIIMVLKAG